MEYDGIGVDYSSIDPHRALKRGLKERLCKQETFPILWLDKLNEIEGVTILEAIVESYIGACDYQRLIDDGILSWEESFIYDFPPFARLNQRFSHYCNRKESRIIDATNAVEVTTEFLVDQGTFKSARHAVVRTIQFPGFHALELAEDIAAYRCLKDFEAALERKEVSTAKVDSERYAAVSKLKERLK